jgi:endoglucanase
MNDPRTNDWVHAAAHWASVYLASDSKDGLNLYDTSALAHADLIGAIRAVHARGLEVSEKDLVGDLKRQLDNGVDAAAEQPFGHAVDVTNFDAATRSFGYAATAQLYRSVTGSGGYDAFGTRQRDFALGANAWGVSLMIGEGSDFSQCPQHQVANLSGSLTGGRRVIRGAVVNGPNGADNFEDLGIPDGANACPVKDGENRFAAFDTAESRFLDDVRAWPSVEPAIDFTATGALALALTARG